MGLINFVGSSLFSQKINFAGLWRFGHGGIPVPDLPWTSHPKPYLLCLWLRLWSDFPLLSHIAKLCSSCSGFFCFCFFKRMWSFFILWGFFVCLFPKKISGSIGLLEIGLVTVFMGLFPGFIFCFSGFDANWVWLLDLDLGFARDWFGCFLDLGIT